MTHHTSFLFRVAEDLKTRFGNQIGNIAIVFNNKRPMVFLKKYLAEVYGQTIICPEMLTIQEFMAMSTDKAIAHDISRFFILLKVYNQLLAEEQQEAVSPDFFYPMSQTLLSDFDQIDYELVNPDALYAQLKDLGEIRQQFHEFTKEQQTFIEQFWSSFSEERQSAIQQKFIELWQRLPHLYQLFDQQLTKKKLTGIAKVYRHLAEGSADNPDFSNTYQSIAFVGFNALNRCEAKLFKRWQDEGKALFYFDGDDYYFKDQMQEAGMFLRRNLNEYGLKNALGDFPERLNIPDKELTIYPVDGFSAQAKTLFFQLEQRKNTNEKTKNPEKRAIILADENLLTPVLQSLPEDEILNITMGLPIRQSKTFSIISLWLDFQEKINDKTGRFSFSEQDLLHFTGLGLPGFTDGEAEEFLQKCAALSLEQMDILVPQFNDSARLFFSEYPNGSACINALRQLIILQLDEQKKNGQIKNIEGNLMLRAYQELNKLQDQLENYQDELSISLALRLIRRCLSGLSAPVQGEPLEGLQIMGMLESRCLDFDEVYWLGANEGLLPKHGRQNSFIPDSLRQAFGLPLLDDKDALSSYLFYRLCQKAGRIHVFYNQLVNNNSSGEISRYVRQLSFESRISLRYRNSGVASEPVKKKENNVVVLRKTTAMQQLLDNYFTEGGKSFSASALKTFMDCPRQFFAKYIARLPDPPEAPEPFAPQLLGTALHDVMQELYQPFEKSGVPVSAQDIKAMKKSLPEICRRHLIKALVKGSFKGNYPHSQWQIAEKIVLENVRLLLRHDEEKVAPFRVVGLEKEYQMSVPLVLSEEGHSEKVNFFAKIDRIDEVNGKIRIVDYKTGGDELEVKDFINLFSSETKKNNPAAFQALFYAFLYYKTHDQIPETHLYILKKIGEGQTQLDFQGEATEEGNMMAQFEMYLGQLIGRICLSENDFAHNPNGKYCGYSPYAFLCEEDNEYDDEENTTP